MITNSVRRLGVVAILFLAVGCGGSGGRPKSKAYPVPPPKEAPDAPPKQNVPLDKTLATAARQEVSDALRSNDPLVRSQGLESLKYSPDELATKQVIDALDDPERGVRFAAAMSAGELKLKKAHPTLVKLANDQSPSVRVSALFALHRLGDHKRSNELGKLAGHENPFVRSNVAMVLGMLGEKSALNNVLRPMKLDHDAHVRQFVNEAMWRLGDEEAAKTLVGLTMSQYADDKVIGLLALAAPRRQIVRQHVRALLAGDDVQVEVTLVAARAMGMLGSDEGYAIAMTGAASQDPQQRFLAALALGSIGRADAQETLRKLLTAPEANVQLAAATAILQLNVKR